MPGASARSDREGSLNATRVGTSVGEPVKLVLQRRARPGAREAFEDWIGLLVKQATRSPALEGSSVLRADGGEYFILLRFSSQAELDRFESSPEVGALLRSGEALATSADEPVRRTGLETWFTLPGLPSPPEAPPNWKMALVTWLALLPQVILLSLVLPPSFPFLAGIALSTAVPVCLLTWVLMPWLTRLLYGWLYAPRAAG